MKSISMEQVLSLQTAKQHFSDCYLVASMNALSRSTNGRKIIQQNIKTDGNAFCVRFNNVNGLAETYLVRQEECDRLVLTNKYHEPIPIAIPHNPIIKAVEVAMNKLLKIHCSKKPFVSHLERCNENFEFNKPSNFLYMFTGIRPITINESGLHMSLKKHRKSAEYIFDRVVAEDNCSFVAGTGFTFDLSPLTDTHCYAVNSSLNSDGFGFSKKYSPFIKFIKIFEGHSQENIVISYDEAIKRLKFLCGYFNESLK